MPTALTVHKASPVGHFANLVARRAALRDVLDAVGVLGPSMQRTDARAATSTSAPAPVPVDLPGTVLHQ